MSKKLIHAVSSSMDAELAAALGHYVNAACGYRWIPTLFDDECDGLKRCPTCFAEDKPAQQRGPASGVRRNVPHYVYRCYDDAGVLLYVGCTNSPVARVKAHRDSWWGHRIARVRHTVFPDRLKALDVEREAIFHERPTCNVKGRWLLEDPRSDWTRDDYRTYRAAVVSAAKGRIGTFTAKLLERIDEEVLDRFGDRIQTRTAAADSP